MGHGLGQQRTLKTKSRCEVQLKQGHWISYFGVDCPLSD